MNASNLFPILLVLVLPLAACNGDAPPPEAVPSADDVAPMPAPADPAAVPGAVPSLPAAFIVSTNEPFWQAHFEGSEVVLSGPDVEGRHFRITVAEAAAGVRQVHASDAAGTISVTLRAEPCQDSMSGASFPQSAELTVDGIGPTPGCARPADMPPPGEPGA